jgi:diguanylate cyclase (GGDEF)-like protein
VRQDFSGLGSLSVETLYKKVCGEKVDEVINFTPVFIPRESCGCAIKVDLERDNALIREERLFLEASTFRLLIRRTTSNLVLLFDNDSLAKELYWSLPELSIHAALVGLYRAPIKSDDPCADRMIDRLFGFDGKEKFNVVHNRRKPVMRFSDYQTLGLFDFERERRAFFFLPLFTKDEEEGVLLISFNRQIPMDVYETLRINISTSVKGAELMSKIQELSITDELTGLFNRRGFFQFAHSKLKNLYREGDYVPIILFLDMDGLKQINDTYGHIEGDSAISAFAQVLRRALRDEDIVGRMGGDEFAIFSTVNSNTDGKLVENRIRAKLEEYNSKSSRKYEIAASIGSVVMEDATIESFDAAMLQADSVLYQEKSEKKKKGLSR